MIRRLQKAVDFERVLRTRSRASSAHFAVHHLACDPASRRLAGVVAGPPAGELSTGPTTPSQHLVDEETAAAPSGVWLGAVVPKRHARRAVTRTLLKRQIRHVVGDGAGALARGIWVVRLRAPFDRKVFESAASEALRRHARAELQQLLAAAIERLPRR